MASLFKNVGAQNFTFCMITASNGVAFTVTSVTNFAAFVAKDGGAQAATAGTITSLSNGQYNYAPTTAETNATDVGVMFTVTGAIPVNIDFHTDLVDATGNLQVDAVRINNVATTSVTTVAANVGTTQPINFTGTSTTALVKTDAIDINSVAASAVTTINANVGTTQPVNFTGTSSSALVKADTIDWNSSAVGALPTNFSSLSIDSNGNVAVTSNVKKNTASSGFMFVMTNSTTGAPQTGLTVTATRSIDGAAFGSATNSVSEISSGWYTINLSAADMNGNHIALKFSATGANDTDIELVTQP